MEGGGCPGFDLPESLDISLPPFRFLLELFFSPSSPLYTRHLLQVAAEKFLKLQILFP